jgi:hypothetical protein
MIYFILCILFLFFDEASCGKTTKGKELVIYDGYEYRKKELTADYATQIWTCPIKTCPGRSVTIDRKLFLLYSTLRLFCQL